MAKASDNQFPKVIMEEVATDGSATSSPAADHRALFLGEDGLLHLKDSGGTVTDVGGGSGDVATDAIWDAKGDLAAGSAANTAVRVAVGANGTFLKADSGAAGGVSWDTPAGSSDWTGTLIPTADHTVTNDATMTAHAPASGPVLEFAVDAASKYFAEFWIAYSGNDIAGDYKWDFSIPTLSAAAQVQGWHSGVSTTLASQFASGGAIGTTTAWPSSPAFVGTDASHTIFMFHGQFTVVTNGAGTITFRFANAAASAGRESTTRAGSMLRYRKIA